MFLVRALVVLPYPEGDYRTTRPSFVRYEGVGSSDRSRAAVGRGGPRNRLLAISGEQAERRSYQKSRVRYLAR